MNGIWMSKWWRNGGKTWQESEKKRDNAHTHMATCFSLSHLVSSVYRIRCIFPFLYLRIKLSQIDGATLNCSEVMWVCLLFFAPKDPIFNLSANKSIHFKNTNFKITRFTQWRIIKCRATVRFPISHILIHPNGLATAKPHSNYEQYQQIRNGKNSYQKLTVYRTYPPPIVIIDASAAIKSSEPWPKFLSPSMPTQGYFARSGYSENRNVSPVPKYACRCPWSSFKLRSNQRVEQYAPNTYWNLNKNKRKNMSLFRINQIESELNSL